MRWLILGPYAPEQGEGARWTTLAAVERLDRHDEVTAISPRPSAAHHHRPLVGWRALLHLLREVDGGVGLWARVEPDVLLSAAPSRVRAVVERVILGAVLRRAASSVLDVGDPGLFPGGRAGALVFRAVDQLVVHSEEDRTRLIAAGADPDRIVMRAASANSGGEVLDDTSSAAAAPTRPAPPADFSHVRPGMDREALEAVIRERARAVEVSRTPG